MLDIGKYGDSYFNELPDDYAGEVRYAIKEGLADVNDNHNLLSRQVANFLIFANGGGVVVLLGYANDQRNFGDPELVGIAATFVFATALLLIGLSILVDFILLRRRSGRIDTIAEDFLFNRVTGGDFHKEWSKGRKGQVAWIEPFGFALFCVGFALTAWAIVPHDAWQPVVDLIGRVLDTLSAAPEP